MLGADTRATEGDTVCDKNCEKIHYMAPNIYCCGAGTAADTEAVTGMVSGQLALHRYNTGRGSRVVTALTMLKGHLFKYQGQVSAALVLGGVDHAGPHLHTVYPHGSTDSNPYVTMGSGSLAAMSIFEADYKEGMSRDEAVALVAKGAFPLPLRAGTRLPPHARRNSRLFDRVGRDNWAPAGRRCCCQGCCCWGCWGCCRLVGPGLNLVALAAATIL